VVHIRPSLTFKHLSLRDTKVCIPKQNKLATCCTECPSRPLIVSFARNVRKLSKEMEITGLPVANRTGDWLRLYGRNDMDHPSYSLDLAPGYFHLFESLNPLKPELNPICYLLTLLGAHHFLHVSRIRVKLLTFRRVMSYIYGAPILDVCRPHTTTQHSR